MQIDDLSRSGRPMELNVELIKQIIEEDSRWTSPDLEEQLGCSHTAVEKHLNELEKTCRYRVWIPDELSTHQFQQRADVWLDLITSHNNYQWLRNLITDDEKCLFYINYKHRYQSLNAGETVTTTSKSDRHPNESDAESIGLFNGKFFEVIGR